MKKEFEEIKNYQCKSFVSALEVVKKLVYLCPEAEITVKSTELDDYEGLEEFKAAGLTGNGQVKRKRT